MFFILLAFLPYVLGSNVCPPLPGSGLPNGRFLRININSIQMICDEGFVLTGNKMITCNNGTWTPDFDAECFRPQNVCPPPPDVANARRTGCDRTIGSRCYYDCHQGYFMSGRNMLRCDEHRHWDHDPPICIPRLSKVSDIADRLRNEANERDEVGDQNNITRSKVRGLILDKEVHTKGLELFLLLDRSSSVDPIDLELSKSFFQTLIKTFKVDNSLKSSKTRLCVISFGSKATVDLALNNQTVNSTDEAMFHVNKIKPDGGGTAMTAALATVVDFVGEFRENAKRALFLLTDGEPNIGETPPEDIAGLLKNLQFEIFAVGIGRDISRNRLVKIASEPSENHVFFLDTFQDFQTILDLVQNPPPTTTPIPPPGPDACGIELNDRKHSKPWLTAIVVHHPKQNAVTFCAGVQICSQWVLTSAACLANVTNSRSASQIALIVGAHNLASSGHNAYATQVRISVQEPEDRNASFKLALVKLDHAVPSNISRPVCLHNHRSSIGSEDLLFRELQMQTLLEGWGTRNWNSSLITRNFIPSANRDISLATNVSTLQEYLCSEAVTQRTNIKKPLQDEFICAGSAQNTIRKPKKDSCAGSLGSPLIFKDKDNRYQLLGIQTHHHGCVDEPIIYLSTTRYILWIQSVTKNCQEKHRN